MRFSNQLCKKQSPHPKNYARGTPRLYYIISVVLNRWKMLLQYLWWSMCICAKMLITVLPECEVVDIIMQS